MIIKIKINKLNLLFIDLESTGLDTSRDRIVEIGLVYKGKSRNIRINPNYPISPDASKVHGIYQCHIEDCPQFKDIAPNLFKLIMEADYIVGYNCINFDMKMLYVEFLRAGIELPELKVIDIYNIWQRVEPNKKLSTCYKRFFGEEFKNQHQAEADIIATKLCLEKIMDLYKLDINQSHILSEPKKW